MNKSAKEYLFTSESVSEGHPDKVADQISDAILDAILEQDPTARVAAETLCTTGTVMLAGEISTTANVDYTKIVRDTLKRIGYDDSSYGIDHKGCAVLVAYDKQSPDIAQGVDKAQDDPLEKGAGDQGLMFGYACDETDALMPAPIYYAHRLVEQQSLMRRTGEMPYLRPDAKSQVTMRYVDGRPVSVETVVLSTQHAPEMSEGDKMKPEFVQAVIDKIVRPVFPPEMLKDTKFLINPTGRFVVGGPQGPAVRSLWTPTAEPALTAAVPSPVRILQRWTALRLMPAAMWLRTSLPPVWQDSARSRLHTPSVLPTL